MLVHHQPVLPIGRVRTNGVADQPALPALPARTDRHIFRRLIKMHVIKHLGFHGAIAMVLIDRSADFGQIIFVHDLVALQIESPVTGTSILRNHFLLRIHETAIGHAVIPRGIDDFDFRIADSHDSIARIVVAGIYGNDKLIDQGQQ